MATRFLTPKQIMAAWNLPRNTVYEGIKNGSIPSIRVSKRKILIPEDGLERKLTGTETDRYRDAQGEDDDALRG